MYFRSSVLWVILGAILAALIGCSDLKFGEKDVRNNEVELDTTSFNCMWDIGQKIKAYWEGNLNDKEIATFAECVRTAMDRFSYVTSPRQGYYDPAELARFLNETFLKPQERLTPALVHEIMALKRVILGGDELRITLDEFQGLVDFISLLERLAINNRPYVPVYRMTLNNRDRFAADFIENAKTTLQGFGGELALQLSRSGNAYSVEALRRLIAEAKYIFDLENWFPDGWNADDMIELFVAIKGVSAGGSELTVQPQEWSQLFSALTGFHGIFMDYQKYVRSRTNVLLNSLEPILVMVSSSFNLLERALATPSRIIPFAKIDRVIDIFERKGLLVFGGDTFAPVHLRGESVKATYTHLVRYGLRNRRTVETPQIQGLDLEALNELREEFAIWAEAQTYLTQTAETWVESYRRPQTRFSDGLWSLLRHFDFADQLGSRFRTEVTSPEMEFIIRYIRPFFTPTDTRAFIVPKADLEPLGVRHNWQNLTRMNVIRGLVRLLIRSFGSQERIDSMLGVTADELEAFYTAAKPLGVDLKFMDPRKISVGHRSFNEGNLFTFNGDGVPPREENAVTMARNEFLTYTETMEMLALMWSAGQVRDRLLLRLQEACRPRYGAGPLDVYGDEKIARACFFEQVSRQQFRELDNMPLMQNYILVAPQARRNEIFTDLDAIANVCDDVEWIESSELATMSTVFHYAEVVFSIYDLDRSGFLEGSEIMRAFSRFHGYLSTQVARAMAGRGGDVDPPSVSDLKAIFAFLVDKQRLPRFDAETGDISGRDGALIYYYNFWYFDDDPFQYGFVEIDAPMSFTFEMPPPPANQPEEMPSTPGIVIDRGGLIKVLRVLNELNGTANTICPAKSL